MRAVILALVMAAAPALLAAQRGLRLEELQEAAVANDPRAGQLAMRERETELRLRNLAVERLPTVTLSGEASHQSEVPAIPVRVADAEIPQPPKDRYEAALNVEQLLVDGGVLRGRRRAEEARLQAERARLAAALQPLRAEVAEAFFGAFLLQERLGQIDLLREDLTSRLTLVRAQVVEGAALPGDTAQLRAELLLVTQQAATAEAERDAALAVLAELTGEPIDGNDSLLLPELGDEVTRVRAAMEPDAPQTGVVGPRSHPRYAVFDAERERLAREDAVIRAQTRPRAVAFGRLAYGTPGFEQFTNEPHDYWIAGLRLSWQPWTWGANARERELVRVQQEIVDSEEAAFAATLRRQVEDELAAMDRLEAVLATDDEIIVLREQVEQQALVQLTERVISPAAYVEARRELQEARLLRDQHRVELARARSRYLTTLGVE